MLEALKVPFLYMEPEDEVGGLKLSGKKRPANCSGSILYLGNSHIQWF